MAKKENVCRMCLDGPCPPGKNPCEIDPEIAKEFRPATNDWYGGVTQVSFEEAGETEWETKQVLDDDTDAENCYHDHQHKNGLLPCQKVKRQNRQGGRENLAPLDKCIYGLEEDGIRSDCTQYRCREIENCLVHNRLPALRKDTPHSKSVMQAIFKHLGWVK